VTGRSGTGPARAAGRTERVRGCRAQRDAPREHVSTAKRAGRRPLGTTEPGPSSLPSGTQARAETRASVLPQAHGPRAPGDAVAHHGPVPTGPPTSRSRDSSRVHRPRVSTRPAIVGGTRSLGSPCRDIRDQPAAGSSGMMIPTLEPARECGPPTTCAQPRPRVAGAPSSDAYPSSRPERERGRSKPRGCAAPAARRARRRLAPTQRGRRRPVQRMSAAVGDPYPPVGVGRCPTRWLRGLAILWRGDADSAVRIADAADTRRLGVPRRKAQRATHGSPRHVRTTHPRSGICEPRSGGTPAP
jgi:hypothetical protein